MNDIYANAPLTFFAVLLSLVLDGFDQLIKLFMHCPCCQLSRQHQDEREQLQKILDSPRFEPGLAWRGSVNATTVLCRPPKTGILTGDESA